LKNLSYLLYTRLPAYVEMNDLQERSGPWSGFWIQSQVRGYMKLRLQFYGDQLIGGGTDCAGWFEIRGKMQPDGTVNFGKRYSSHGVEYEGRWDGVMISGLWTMRQPALFSSERFTEEKGDFEMWPEAGEFDAISELFEEPRVGALPALQLTANLRD